MLFPALPLFHDRYMDAVFRKRSEFVIRWDRVSKYGIDNFTDRLKNELLNGADVTIRAAVGREPFVSPIAFMRRPGIK